MQNVGTYHHFCHWSRENKVKPEVLRVLKTKDNVSIKKGTEIPFSFLGAAQFIIVDTGYLDQNSYLMNFSVNYLLRFSHLLET